MSGIGAPVLRREDGRLLTGTGRFVDDVDLPGQLWMRVVRSPVAAGTIERVELGAARGAEGVRAVLCAADLEPMPRIPIRLGPDPAFDPYLQPVLAEREVRYVGEPVAVVLADDPYRAEDAAELVAVEYVPTAAAVDPRDGSVAVRIERADGDVDAAMAAAAHTVEVEVEMGRHTGVPMETRGLVAAFERVERRLTVWGPTKVPHWHRGLLARLLGLPASSVSVRPADVGGAFGVRGEFYPEDYLVPYLALATRRPVKWVEDRAEHLVATNHSRQQRRRVSGAFDAQGRLLGLRDEVLHDNGAYLRTHGVLVPQLTLSMLPGPYRVPAYAGTLDVALTNKTPAGTYRAPGRYEANFARERLLDVAAGELGLDPVELRRRNLLGPGDFPLHRALPVFGGDVHAEAGDPGALLEQTLEQAGFETWREEARAARAGGELLGAGLACVLEKSGAGSYEATSVTVGVDGRVRAATGGTSIGQGLETVVAQAVAERLGVAPELVDVVCGDTDLLPHGGGSWASRSTMYSATSAVRAADEVGARMRELAASLLEADAGDVVLRDGFAHVAGAPATSVPLGRLAELCDPAGAGAGGRGGLTAMCTAEDLPGAFPYGVHLAQVRIDRDTGGVAVTRYFVGYEIGRAVNPALVEGQIVGGVAQGLGGALLEEFVYDGGGQPLATTFMDYMLPGACEVPRVETMIREDVPDRGNPLGVMGAGEGGIPGVGAAVAAALDDALGMPGAIRSLPVAPERLRALAAAARG